MPIKSLALTVTYTAWNGSTGAPQPGDAANHTLRLVRDGVESTPTNTPTEVDATSARGEYRLALTAAEMGVDFITVCGVSSTPNVSIIPVKLATEDGDFAAIAATLALVKARTDLITGPTAANAPGPSASGKTVISATAAYATATDLLRRADARTVARLLLDDLPTGALTLAQSTAVVTGSTVLPPLLMEASGEVELAALEGSVYVPADLAALAGTNGGEKLAGMVCDLVVWRLYDRRPDRAGQMPERCKNVLDLLEMLAIGKRIFGFQESAAAGHLRVDVETVEDVEARNGSVVEGSRYWGRRGDRQRPRR